LDAKILDDTFYSVESHRQKQKQKKTSLNKKVISQRLKKMHVRGSRQKQSRQSSSAAASKTNGNSRQRATRQNSNHHHPRKAAAKVADITDRTASDYDDDDLDNESCMAVMVRPPSIPVDIDNLEFQQQQDDDDDDGTVTESVAAFSVATGYLTQVADVKDEKKETVFAKHDATSSTQNIPVDRDKKKKSSLKKQTTPPREQKRRVQFDAPTKMKMAQMTTTTSKEPMETTNNNHNTNTNITTEYKSTTIPTPRSAAAIFAALEEMDQQFTTQELLDIERREMEELKRQQELRSELFSNQKPSSSSHSNQNKTTSAVPNVVETEENHESDDDDDDVVSILEGNFSLFARATTTQTADPDNSENNNSPGVLEDNLVGVSDVKQGETSEQISADKDEEGGTAVNLSWITASDVSSSIGIDGAPVTATESNQKTSLSDATMDVNLSPEADSVQQRTVTSQKSSVGQAKQQTLDLEQPECAPVPDADEEVEHVKFETRSRRICCGLVVYMGFLLVIGMAIGTVCGLGYCTKETMSSTASQPFNPDETVEDLVFTTTVELKAAVIAYLKDEPDEFPMGKWDVSRIHDFSNLFDVTRTNITSFTGTGKHDVGNWNMSSAVHLDGMFRGCKNFNANLTLWDTSKVESMAQTFENCTRFEGIGLDSWNTSNVRDLSSTFQRAGSFNGNISSWQTGKVTSMHSMLSEAFSFENDLSSWDTKSCRNFRYMFYSIAKFNSDLNSWNVSAAEDTSFMFNECTNFNQGKSSYSPKNVVERYVLRLTNHLHSSSRSQRLGYL
jgi:surface protein